MQILKATNIKTNKKYGSPFILTLLKSLLFLSIFTPTFSRKARCYLIPDPSLNSGVSGEVIFTQDSENSPVVIDAKVYGTTKGKHGFHIHEKNSIQDGCAATGMHFNPLNSQHGDIEGYLRHSGDMGNLESVDGKNIIAQLQSRNMTLFGDHSIIGRTCVFHEKEDDLGSKDDAASKINGNAGNRIACGVVQTYDPLYSMIFGIIVLLIGFSLAVYYFFYYKKKHSADEAFTSNLAAGEVKNI